MKNRISVVKKQVNNANDKKQVYIHNPYNDLPVDINLNTKTIPNKIVKAGTKNLEISKSPNLKTHKMLSPDPVRLPGLSPASNNDSLHKLKTTNAETKKITKKPVKVDKYNDYFDIGNGDGKGSKHLINLSKKSAESNSSAKSIQS